MKGSLRTLQASCLILFALSAAAVYGDPNTEAYQSIMLDNFADDWIYKFDGEEYGIRWKTVASRYVTKTNTVSYPTEGYIETAPRDIEIRADPARFHRSAPADPLASTKSLGIQFAFNRKGNNWVDVYPTLSTQNGEAVSTGDAWEIPLQGRTRYVDVWAWGSNNLYRLDAYVRDNTGRIHIIPMGSLNYRGWKNLTVKVPDNIPMVSKTLPRSTHDTTFVKFRIWSEPTARVATSREKDGSIVPIYVYLAQLKVLADIYETTYDGDELADPKATNDLWKAASSSTPAAGQ